MSVDRARMRLTIVSDTHRADYSMPTSDAPVRCLAGLQADMLHGATLYVGGARRFKNERLVPSLLMPAPKTKELK